jgi:hypothetical protein
MTGQPWHELDPAVAAVLRPVLSEVAGEIIAAVREVPAYSRPIEGPFGSGVRAGVEEALRHMLAEIEAQGRVQRSDVYFALGRGEVRAGRRLEALLAAYRVGARVAWRRFAAAGVAAGLAPDTLYLLAESVFAYIDELSAESAEGYALEQSALAGEAELRRRRLVTLLVRDPPPEPMLVEAAAQAAGWPLPRAVSVLAVAGAGRDGAVAAMPSGTIAEVIAGVACVVVPDPEGPGRPAAVRRAVEGAEACAGLGPVVEPGAAARSFARARAALELGEGHAGLTVARERAGELLLRSDPELAAELAGDRLAAFEGLPAGARARLLETLSVWLAEQGRLGVVATRLGVHTQTVRYRLGRLRELLGDALEDPEARFWLEVALRVRP